MRPLLRLVAVPGEYIRRAPRLRLIQTFSAGVDGIDRAAVLERGDIIVCNSHLNASEVAEYAVALLLCAAKRTVPRNRDFRTGSWKHG